jgi:3-oxoacyl-[acyl-carrier-protein] synthase I
VDSLLNAPRIEELLAQSRLVQGDNTDALVPGEGAACLLVRLSGPSAQDAVWIDGVAHAQDAWRLTGSQPMRATALTQVLREAASSVGLRVADMDFHASGANGEQWCAREIEMALSRAMEQRRDQFPHHSLAQFLGDTGASLSLLTVAWVAEAMRKPWRPLGRHGLLHFAGADGQRSALAIAHRQTVPTATLKNG